MASVFGSERIIPSTFEKHLLEIFIISFNA